MKRPPQAYRVTAPLRDNHRVYRIGEKQPPLDWVRAGVWLMVFGYGLVALGIVAVWVWMFVRGLSGQG